MTYHNLTLSQFIETHCTRFKSELQTKVAACLDFHRTNKAWDKPHENTTAVIKRWVDQYNLIPNSEDLHSLRLHFAKLLDKSAYEAQNTKSNLLKKDR